MVTRMSMIRETTAGKTQTAEARSTARGTVKIVLSMVVAAVAGLVIHTYLARTLKPEFYGLLVVVTSVVVWWELALGALFRQATERAVAASGDRWPDVAGSAIRSAILLSALSAAACYAMAPWIADALGDDRLAEYIRLMSLDIPLWVLWAVWTSVLNGRRRYGLRAGSAITYWTAKALLMCALVAFGLSLRGAIIGSIAASAVGLVVAWGLVGIGLPAGRVPWRDLIVFGLPLMAVALVDHVVLTMDLWFVKALVPDPGAAGVYGVGRYAFQAAAMLPLAVCGAAFPTMTRAIEADNQDSLEELIREASRFSLILIMPLIAIMACCGREVIALVFGQAYASSWMVALILLGGALVFGLRLVGSNALVASGRPRLVLLALAPTVPLNIGLNYVFVPAYGLPGGAMATVLSLLLGAAVVWVYVWRHFRVRPSAQVVVRSGLAASAVYGCGLLVPGAGWALLPKVICLGGLYLLLLLVLGELDRRDFEPLRFWRSGLACESVRCVD
ncbi:MAG: oligosaccharide flippase family protein [Armatimonadia bacterium]|nr:oligosaccharide flippase family protein [Armatimonadia bacterium]